MRVVVIPVVLAVTLLQAQAQQSATPQGRAGAMGTEEATTLTQGWAYLAQGDLAKAAQKASEALAASPRGGAAAALAIEVEIAQNGSTAGLEVYERWLGNRTMEEPALLRRVAQAMLHEFAAQPQNPTARFEALRALAEEGEAVARNDLAAASTTGGTAETRALAAMGDARAVRALIDQLKLPTPTAPFALEALGKSKSPMALETVRSKLTDSRPEVRGAAALALGQIQGVPSIPSLQAMLKDQSMHVRMKSAQALYTMGDTSGLSVLLEAVRSDTSDGRLAAAEAMASSPTPEWLALVRSLTTVSEPEVRLGAARLLAAYDQAASTAVLQALSNDPNQAIRTEATETLAQVTMTDFPVLRALMRNTARLTRVYAASSVLKATR
jgi:HEAT repeat protein